MNKDLETKDQALSGIEKRLNSLHMKIYELREKLSPLIATKIECEVEREQDVTRSVVTQEIDRAYCMIAAIIDSLDF